MPITDQSKAILAGMLSGLSPEQKTTLGNESTQDLAQATSELVSHERSVSMGNAMLDIIAGTVADWDALESLSYVADSATIYDRLASFTTAMGLHQATPMLAHAVSVALAAKKHFRV